MELYDGIEAPWQYDNIAGLNAYLNKVWKERPLIVQDDEEERRETDQLFIRLKEENIRPRNYVGFVQYGDLRLNIYPRVFHGAEGFDAKAHIWHVLKWLSYARRIHFPFSATDLDTAAVDDWLEALIYLFAKYTHKILSASPHFAYQEVVEEMAFVRGSIAMPEYIRDNLATGRHHRVTCRYEPFLYDTLFNRIVKNTCRLLHSVSYSPTNRQSLSRILFLLD